MRQGASWSEAEGSRNPHGQGWRVDLTGQCGREKTCEQASCRGRAPVAPPWLSMKGAAAGQGAGPRSQRLVGSLLPRVWLGRAGLATLFSIKHSRLLGLGTPRAWISSWTRAESHTSLRMEIQWPNHAQAALWWASLPLRQVAKEF